MLENKVYILKSNTVLQRELQAHAKALLSKEYRQK